ncbi:MAG: fibrobacter succinogenes major paralogous domain-containing protein, partial [Prevotellaceae bacterium]|nr:fibrobacter succinogenes major paralogous domain-containing protein [Prevotellaceae bacterium]
VNTALTGTIIYNTNIDLGLGVFVWDGDNWQPVGEPYIPHTTVPAPTCPNPVPDVTFMAYNLGADVAELMSLYPDLSPAKQQMKYQANHAFSAADATVWGDLYQWGRVADGHEKRDAVAYGTDGPLPVADLYPTTGQVKDDTNGGYNKADTNQKYGHFIKNTAYTSYDWRTPKKDDLWGNGVAIGTATSGGVKSTSDDLYYQSTDWVISQNNPCPLGWRIPTQDEWERLGDYGCGVPQTAGGNFSISTSTESISLSTLNSTNAPLTWVRVKEGKAFAGTWVAADRSGFAIYKTTDWNGANASYTSGTADLFETAAPEPLLFLPTTGIRNISDGSVSNLGYFGYYGSSTAGNNAHNVAFYDNYLHLNIDEPRIFGAGVRCVKK